MINNTEILVDIMSENLQASTAVQRIDFEEAFSLHHRTVFRAARSIVNDCGLAEDVTQEVFIRLFKNIETIVEPEMLKPWLIRVALNVARNTIRGNIRANTRDENYVKESGVEHIRSVEAEYEDKSGVNEISNALAGVKEPLRSCLILKQQGLSYKEIADSLSLNESSIGTFISRGRKEFLKLYNRL